MKTIHKNRKIFELSLMQKELENRVFSAHIRYPEWFPKMVEIGFKVLLLDRVGRANALKLVRKNVTLSFSTLPKEFDGFTIAFLSDLHLDSHPTLGMLIEKVMDNIESDIILLGGDYRHYHAGNDAAANRQLTSLSLFLAKKSESYAILGNHDTMSQGDILEKAGVTLLYNEHVKLTRGEASIYLAGVDDDFSFSSADVNQATKDIPKNDFTILASHSPEIYKQCCDNSVNLMFTGHTHGGQICLPGGIPLMKGANIPRKMVGGVWKEKDMIGFTSCGIGSSVYPVRLFCPPEIVVITLKSKHH